MRESISEYFNVNKSEKVRNLFYTNRFKMATMLKNKDTYILMIDDACKELLKAIPQDRTLRKLDKQKNGNKYQPI